MWPLRLGEEKKKIEERNHRMKIQWPALFHRAAIINYSKTKEMLLGSLLKLDVPGLDIDHNLNETVSGFKLLGVHVSNNLSWNVHVDYICATANTRLHYLKG